MKKNLPVILLRGIVLLPHNEIRLEFDNEISKNIIELSELFHNNRLLIVCDNEIEDMDYNKENLPKKGLISKIVKKVDLPNGKTRIIIRGEKRAIIKEYLNVNRKDESLESIVEEINDIVLKDEEEALIIRKLMKSLTEGINDIPYLSNSVINLVSRNNNLSMITDLIAPTLPIDNDRMLEYLNEANSTTRVSMIISDLEREKELIDLEKNLDLKVKQEIDDHQKEFILREKIKMMKEELGEAATKDDEIDELRKRIESLDAPEKIKTRLYKECNKYENVPSSSPEAAVIKNYIDCVLDLPWGIYTTDNDDLKSVREYLDKTHHGMDKVKDRIIEYLAVKQMKNNLKSPILCLVGPPGVGKTSLAFSISKAINRNFVKISLGGVSDESEIKGHRKAYIGSSPGRIISSMKKAKSNNPVFLIDEIDKLTKGINGDPAAALLEVLDPEQNEFFSDNYVEEDYDLSKVMFVATANYVEQIPEALKDRLEIIDISGYTEYEKLDIAKKHLIKKICENHGISDDNIEISDEIILTIIRFYTRESGVRELERLLSQIVRKVVTNIVMNKKEIKKEVIKETDLYKYLGRKKYHFIKSSNGNIGVVNGLAYTYFGGDTLPIEVNYYMGKGNLVLTGSLGEVMKESAQIALGYLKSNYKHFNIPYNKLTENDIHIHIPEGAIPKEGPSAGIALTTALVSSLTKTKVSSSLAMTGEITLRGNVLAIGGLKEKSIGAHRKGIKEIIIPYDNLKDLEDIPEDIKKDIHYIPVKTYKEVLKYILDNK